MSKEPRSQPKLIKIPTDLHGEPGHPCPEAIGTEATQDAIDGLIDIMTRVAAGDFSEKPALPDAGAPLSRFTVAFRFLIDDLERAHVQRKAEIDGLRELDEAKTRFINLAAHELNTPLTPLRIHLHMLEENAGNLTAAQLRSLESLSRNLTRLSTSVGDLIDVARLQGGKLRIEQQPVDLAHLVRMAASDLEPTLAGRDLAIHVASPDHLFVQADGDRIMQVLYNLLTNAHKYSRANGTVTLHLTDAGDRAMLSVTDSCGGLTEGQISQLFHPFVQIHPDHQQATEGIGLGLFISKGIVEAHGGRIWCASDGPDVGGCRFSFTLPKGDPTQHGIVA